MANMTIEEFRQHKGYLYAKDIVDGRIVTSKYLKKEALRFIDMIDNEESRLHKLYFIDLDMVYKIDGIIKLMNFSTGEYAGKECYSYIQPFQWYILFNIYAVKLRSNPNKRRFEKACIFVSRKNAKTWLVSTFMILALLFEPDYAQLVAAANTRDQAKILFNEIKKTLEVSPYLAKFFKILSNNITCKLNNNYLFPIAAEARTTDGLLVSVGCVDEYGAAKDTAIYDSLQTSMLSTVNRMLFTISTGYPYPNNPMKDQIDYGKKVLDDLIEDDKFFMMCYELDEDDDWTDETKWIKSNPLQATSELGMDFLRSECKMALELKSKQLSFRCKNLNQWLDGDDSEVFIPIEDIRKGKLKNDFNWNGKEVKLGIDLAQSGDLCAVTMVHYDNIKDEFYVKSWAFLPEDTLDNRCKVEKIDYRMMARKEHGYCFPCGDRIVSYSFIEDFIMNLEDKYGVIISGIGYDRYNCISSINRIIEKKDYDCIEVRQHSTVLGPACKKTKEYVLKEKFFYDTNRLLEIQFGNCRSLVDNNMNTYISKKRSNGKIDMIAALLNAMTLWNFSELEGNNVYESDDREGFILL